MNPVPYSKHKECTPEETVDRVKSILDSIGIETEVKWNDTQYEGAWSNRITIKGVTLGTNGKGTSREYALASGYAEFMERLQNDSLSNREYYFDYQKILGYYHFPDEKLMTPEEFLTENGGVLETWLNILHIPEEKRIPYLFESAELAYYRTDGRMPGVPFYDLTEERVIYVPVIFLKRMVGSNGMAAGNTLNEAFTQGLSEIFERHAQLKILKEDLTPPEVPKEYLQYADVAELIRTIESDRRYRVNVYDCSLGEGFPVLGTMFRDLEKGTFGFKLGAHPSFAVALERTLTEAFQGKSLENASDWNYIASFAEATSDNNLIDQLSKGKGAFAPGILSRKPDWDFVPWPDAENLSNEALKDSMLEFCRKKGFRVLVRDNSWLGFAACQILVPGVSEVNQYYHAQDRSQRENYFLQHVFNRFPNFSREEEETVLHQLELCKRFTLLRETRFLFRRPLASGMMAPVKLRAFLHLKHEHFAEAAEEFKEFSQFVEGKAARLYWQAMGEYARLRSLGISQEEVFNIIEQLYPVLITSRLKEDVNPETMMERCFLPMNCFHCEDCRMEERGYCKGMEEKEAIFRYKKAISQCRIEQTGLK